MFGSMFARSAAQACRTSGRREVSTFLYKNVWRKSNVSYLTFVVLSAAIVETIFGKGVDYIWEANNHGKLYKDIDWSKFKTEDDEDEE